MERGWSLLVSQNRSPRTNCTACPQIWGSWKTRPCQKPGQTPRWMWVGAGESLGTLARRRRPSCPGPGGSCDAQAALAGAREGLKIHRLHGVLLVARPSSPPVRAGADRRGFGVADVSGGRSIAVSLVSPSRPQGCGSRRAAVVTRNEGGRTSPPRLGAFGL